MLKTMLEVRVSVSEGKIIIDGPETPQYDINPSVEIHPDQVDILIGWLQEAKKEILDGAQ